MECCVVASGAEVFGVDCSGFLATAAFFDFGFPIYFFITGVTETLCVMFFFFRAIATYFYHHSKKRRSYIK